MLKGLGIPTAKVFLFARIIASREPRPILGQLPKGGCTGQASLEVMIESATKYFFGDRNGDGKT